MADNYPGTTLANGVIIAEEIEKATGKSLANDQGSNGGSDSYSNDIRADGTKIGEKAAEAMGRSIPNDQGSDKVTGGPASTLGSVQPVNVVSSAPSGAVWYDREWRAIKAANPDWTDNQVTNKMSEIIWNNNYKALMNDIANSSSPEEREQKIREHQSELDKYKASGIDVDNDEQYLRDTQGMPSESILNKLISTYVASHVEYPYSVAPGSLVGVDAPNGISIEGQKNFQAQKQDDEATAYNSIQQGAESFKQHVKAGASNGWNSVTENTHFKKDFEEDGKKYKYQLDVGGYGVRVIDDSAKQDALLRAKVDEYGQSMLGILPWVGTGGFGRYVGVARRVVLKAEKIADGVLSKEVNSFTAEETNRWFVNNVRSDYKPPYKPGTVVKEIELTEDTVFVRVYDNDPGGSGMYGSWVMKAKDIEGLTPKQIQDKFALPNTPKYRCDVELDAGTHIRVGEVNPLDGWGSGGGTQYDLIGQRVGNFVREKLLK